ncbi:hypothetical protein [Klebsiella pneumoniae]|uniref:hypothetical protein n=1 Tax=Klebsiella pneumoniae TaxID=573 RepID=UPI001D0EA195|nr:hypothetical protein [Klebsiella pneumoniae]
MTDITELAQQEMAQLRDELLNQEIGSKDHLRKIALSLLDKLEKCRDREIRWLALSDEKSKIITDQEEALAAEKRICATWRKTAEANSEKLEKAQQQMTESENRVRKQNRHICELFDDNTALRKRIAELESRTVTVKLASRRLPSDYVDGEFGNDDLAAIHNACRLECKVSVEKYLSAHGIVVKWEDE